MFLHLLMCTYSCVATLIPSSFSVFIACKIRGGEGKEPGESYQMVHDTANIKGSRQKELLSTEKLENRDKLQ